MLFIPGIIVGWVACYLISTRPVIRTLREVTQSSLDIIERYDQEAR